PAPVPGRGSAPSDDTSTGAFCVVLVPSYTVAVTPAASATLTVSSWCPSESAVVSIGMLTCSLSGQGSWAVYSGTPVASRPTLAHFPPLEFGVVLESACPSTETVTV